MTESALLINQLVRGDSVGLGEQLAVLGVAHQLLDPGLDHVAGAAEHLDTAPVVLATVASVAAIFAASACASSTASTTTDRVELVEARQTARPVGTTSCVTQREGLFAIIDEGLVTNVTVDPHCDIDEGCPAAERLPEERADD